MGRKRRSEYEGIPFIALYASPYGPQSSKKYKNQYLMAFAAYTPIIKLTTATEEAGTNKLQKTQNHHKPFFNSIK